MKNFLPFQKGGSFWESMMGVAASPPLSSGVGFEPDRDYRFRKGMICGVLLLDFPPATHELWYGQSCRASVLSAWRRSSRHRCLTSRSWCLRSVGTMLAMPAHQGAWLFPVKHDQGFLLLWRERKRTCLGSWWEDMEEIAVGALCFLHVHPDSFPLPYQPLCGVMPWAWIPMLTYVGSEA